jgi:hypothetical protein
VLNPLFESLLIPAVCFLFNVVIQALVSFRRPTLGIVKSLMFGMAAGGVLFLVLEICQYRQGTFALDDFVGLAIVNWTIYFSLSYCFFHFIHISEASVRIRILRELQESKEGLSRAEILKHYNAETILSARLERLVSSGQIRLREGRYFSDRPKMLYIAKTFRLLKWLVLGDKR